MKNKLSSLILAAFILVSCQPMDHQSLSLAGKWQFRLDPENQGLRQNWMNQTFADPIKLPGTTDENGYGTPSTDTAFGILSRAWEYVGPAWYNKEITIPEKWEDQVITLFLERVIWESQVFVDGKEMGVQDALAAPHIHPLGKLSPGKHLLSIRINNDLIHNIGDKGHAYGEYMQSIWNGIVGRIELQASPALNIEAIRTFPQGTTNQVRIELTLSQKPTEPVPSRILIQEKTSGKLVDSIHRVLTEQESHFTLTPELPLHRWNEFDPYLYEAIAVLNPDSETHRRSVSFGMAEVSANQHQILLNEQPIFLRGNLDCIHFPLTGYPAMDKKSWKKIFQAYKDYGLNHVRFHSWCPPEAAFEAADEMGIYIQAEASLWIDWWMGTDMIAEGRPEMDTKGHPQGLGKGDPDADQFIWEEMQQVVNTYGNHPSFLLFCIGNELGSSDFELMGNWIKQLKELDPRRLYAASTARTITPSDDYSATHSVPGIGGVRQKMVPHLNWDYEEKYSRAPVPIIAHEIGQWPVYPDWEEIKKYTGVLKPRNLEQLAGLAKRNGVYEKDVPYRRASGALSALLYKDEIESFMRTPSCAGFQLLSMQDYIGQGEAVIGWLDSFYEPKGTLTPEAALQFLNVVVPLVKLPSYTFAAGAKLEAEVLLHHYGPEALNDQIISWEVQDLEGKERFGGSFPASHFSRGALHPVGTIRFELPQTPHAEELRLIIRVNGKPYSNSWPIWVYPSSVPEPASEIILTNQLNEQTINELQQGKSVLFVAHQSGTDDNQKLAAWKPLYWSASFFPGQSIETLGMLIDQEHPAFREFPTASYGSWNWYRICEKAHGFDLSDFPPEFKALVEPISDFHYCRKLGSVFELRVGTGKLLICGYNILPERDNLPEVKQLRHSLISYMNSPEFNPEYEIPLEQMKVLFPYVEPAKSEAPGAFKESSLFLEAAGNQMETGNYEWDGLIDKVLINKGLTYNVEAEGTWKDEVSAAWFGKEMTINLQVPAGSIGAVYLYFDDWNKLNRDGFAEIENRNFSLGNHGTGKWIQLPFMREDTQDGELQIITRCSAGPNLMISKMAVVW